MHSSPELPNLSRSDFLKELLISLFDRRHLRRVLFILSNLVTNAVAARCIAELIHTYESIGDETQCFSTQNFLKLAAIVFSIITFLSLPEINKAGIDLKHFKRSTSQKGCRCYKCSQLVIHILSALGPASAAGAALTGAIHSARDLFLDTPCGEFTAVDIVPGVLAGCYVWLYQSLANVASSGILSKQSVHYKSAFRNMGYILKHIPIIAPLFARDVGEILAKETQDGTVPPNLIRENTAWCIAYVFMLCIMSLAGQGTIHFTNTSREERRPLLLARDSLLGYPQLLSMPSSWSRFLVALVGAGSLGIFAAEQAAEVISREGSIDSPRFPASYEPYSFYSCKVMGTLFVMALYSCKFYLGLQGLRRVPKTLPSLNG